MASDEEQEVFEITDFTTASEWERFIARIEEVIHDWKLPARLPGPPLQRDELTRGKWEEEREIITFANFKFEMRHHFLTRQHTHEEKQPPQEDTEAQRPTALEDLMSRENDFPSRAHCLVRWYGLRDFVVISPARSEEVICVEDRAKLLISSVTIAINNTNSLIPIFIQLYHSKQKFYLGVCEGGGIHTDFEMVVLGRVPQQYNHLSGLLSIFKSKLGCPAGTLSPVSVTVRFTYLLRDWSPDSWPVSPPDVDIMAVDAFPSELGNLPFGAMEDPVAELYLSTTWPLLMEDIIVDNDVHSDLDPLQAPQWMVRVKFTDHITCFLSEYLMEFAALCTRAESVEQLIGDLSPDEDDAEAKSPQIAQALDRLTGGPALPSFSSALPHNRLHTKQRGSECHIEDELLIKILQFVFPDASPSSSQEEIMSSEMDMGDLQNDEIRSQLLEQLSSFKSAPSGSLTWRLALTMCKVNHSYGGIGAVAHLWREFLLEMRYRWENNFTLSCLEPGIPNLAFCLLHQKLQMLNCCIDKKRTREWQQASSSKVEEPSPPASLHSDSEEEDEFFECNDTPAASDEQGNKGRKTGPAVTAEQTAEGRLRRCGDLTLLGSDTPLYIPVTQEPAPMTEDLLEEHAEVLVQLGTNPEGAALRARMQSACLTSDMEAFKAANPGAALEDFVRWYSPRDWIEDENGNDAPGTSTKSGSLSKRMQLPGNIWQEAWETASPVPVRRQKRLFDDTKEAERVLHFLAALKPADVAIHLMPIVIHAALLILCSKIAEGPRHLPATLEQIAKKAVMAMRSPQPNYQDIIKLLCQAEIQVAHAKSLKSKFGASLERDNKDTDSSAPFKEARLAGSAPSRSGELIAFVLDLLDHPEVEVPGAGKGRVGRTIRQLFSDSQRTSHLIFDEKPLASSSTSNMEHHPTVPEFPPPLGKEFILRTVATRPAPYSTPSPQRMHCVLMQGSFCLAGAFSEDNTFQA